MPNNKQVSVETYRVLVKLRPSNAMRAAESRANLRPLYDMPQTTAAVLGLGAEPQWFGAELPDGAATPWDLAHARVAEQRFANCAPRCASAPTADTSRRLSSR